MSERRDSTDPFDWSKLRALKNCRNLTDTGSRPAASRKKKGTFQLTDFICLLFFLAFAPLIAWTLFRDRSNEESLQEFQDRLRYQEIIAAPKRLADELHERDPELRRLKEELGSGDPEVAERAYRTASERMNRLMSDEELERYNGDSADSFRRDESP